MSKTNSKNVLCFIDGEPNLYNKEIKVYFPITISVNKAMHIVTSNIILSPNVRPGMKDVWNTLAENLEDEDCDGFSNYFSKKSRINFESFENIFTREIKKFLDEIYPPERLEEMFEKRRKYEENKRKNACESIAAARRAKERLMLIKNGKKLY